MKRPFLLVVVACLVPQFYASAAPLNATVVLPDRAECQDRLERLSATSYACTGRGKNLSANYTGELPAGDRIFRFQGCRVVLEGRPGGYQISVIQEPDYPRRFLTEMQARGCLAEAFDIGRAAEVAVSALSVG